MGPQIFYNIHITFQLTTHNQPTPPPPTLPPIEILNQDLPALSHSSIDIDRGYEILLLLLLTITTATTTTTTCYNVQCSFLSMLIHSSVCKLTSHPVTTLPVHFPLKLQKFESLPAQELNDNVLAVVILGLLLPECQNLGRRPHLGQLLLERAWLLVGMAWVADTHIRADSHWFVSRASISKNWDQLWVWRERESETTSNYCSNRNHLHWHYNQDNATRLWNF